MVTLEQKPKGEEGVSQTDSRMKEQQVQSFQVGGVLGMLGEQ